MEAEQMTVDRKRLRDLALAANARGQVVMSARTLVALLDALDAAEQPAPDDARLLTTTEQIGEYLDVLTAEGHAEDARDAKRYRWLCDASGQEWEALAPYQLVGQLDAAIDAAIQAQERT